MAEQLTDELMLEIREIFDLWGGDDSDRFDVRNLKPLMSGLMSGTMVPKAEQYTVTNDMLRSLFASLDTDDSWTIDFDEFVKILTSKLGDFGKCVHIDICDVVARLSSRTVRAGCRMVHQSTPSYKAKLEKARVAEQALPDDLCNDLAQVTEAFKSASW